MPFVTIAGEGITDVIILRQICRKLGIDVARQYVAGGKSKLDARISGYNKAAAFSPWCVLRDLDSDAECAAQLVQRLLPQKEQQMLLRIPVRTVESWLLADRRGLSTFLAVKIAVIPTNPELIARPKRALVDIARQSRQRQIRRDMVPEPGTSSEVGAGFTARVTQFVQDHWSANAAAGNSLSLARCLRALGAVPG